MPMLSKFNGRRFWRNDPSDPSRDGDSLVKISTGGKTYAHTPLHSVPKHASLHLPKKNLIFWQDDDEIFKVDNIEIYKRMWWDGLLFGACFGCSYCWEW